MSWYVNFWEREPMSSQRSTKDPGELTLTIIGPRPSEFPTVSMYFFRSRSRNSNTKYSF